MRFDLDIAVFIPVIIGLILGAVLGWGVVGLFNALPYVAIPRTPIIFTFASLGGFVALKTLRF